TFELAKFGCPVLPGNPEYRPCPRRRGAPGVARSPAGFIDDPARPGTPSDDRPAADVTPAPPIGPVPSRVGIPVDRAAAAGVLFVHDDDIAPVIGSQLGLGLLAGDTFACKPCR